MVGGGATSLTAWRAILVVALLFLSPKANALLTAGLFCPSRFGSRFLPLS
jgi:hypothetical protein